MAHYYLQQKTPTRGFSTKLLVPGCQIAHHRVRAGLYGNQRAARNVLETIYLRTDLVVYIPPERRTEPDQDPALPLY